MQRVDSEHGLELWVTIDQIMVLLQIAKVVIDCIVDKGDLNFLASAGLLQAHQVCIVVVDKVLGRGEGTHMAELEVVWI